MKKLELFKSEDFKPIRGVSVTPHEAAEMAQSKLNAFIESCPVVYLYGYGNPLDSEISINKSNWKDRIHYNISSNLNRSITHQARIFGIEQIVKEPCKHEPRYIDQSYKLPDSVVCKHCGVGLKVDRSEKK
jgi:hypothetical protein